MTRSSRPEEATRRTAASAAAVAETSTGLQPDDHVPELLALRGDLFYPDVLRLHVLLQAPRPELAPHPRLLVAAVGGGRREQVPVVDPDRPGPQAPGHGQGPG